MKQIELEERKQIQMDILESVERFCVEHHIKYSIACGTLLGAIRHGGYIPWDDDIDIYMLREDYNKFENEFPRLWEDKYELVSLNREPLWNNMFSKVCDTRTIVVERILAQEGIGINIDIFPIDDIPDNDEEWAKFNKQRRKDFELTRRAAMCVSPNRPWWENILIRLLKLRFIFFNPREFGFYRNEMIQQHNGKGYKRVFETSSGMRVKNPFPKELFDSIVKIPFEDRNFYAFQNHKEYLTCTFGDYMQLPPVEKRRSFHTYDTYWKEEQ